MAVDTKKEQEIVIPVPSYEEQKRIADILDSFHYLVNDIAEGIPAEIEVRKNSMNIIEIRY